MSARTPLILLVVAAILLAYVLLFERDRPGRTEIDVALRLAVGIGREGTHHSLPNRVRG